MSRETDLELISDGALYTAENLVKISCNDCKGCSQCCHDMGTSIVLDPYDIYELCKGVKTSAAALLQTGRIELNVEDGVIVPNLRMDEETLSCSFLNNEGRCTIHDFRPGFCRLFPLGRVYDENSFKYFNQIHECTYPSKSKVKVKKWLGIPSLAEYERFILNWHSLVKELKLEVEKLGINEETKDLNLRFLEHFYLSPYDIEEDFYSQIYERIQKWER